MNAETALFVNGDDVLLRELLVNLLDNAIAYGYERGNISVKLDSLPMPCLTIIDDGPGIPEPEMCRVFERFYRIPGSPNNGCGLGLSIVKDIAERHNASFKLSRASAQGGLCIELAFNKQTG